MARRKAKNPTKAKKRNRPGKSSTAAGGRAVPWATRFDTALRLEKTGDLETAHSPPGSWEETRGRDDAASQQTDRERWSELANFDSSWDMRAALAARFLPAGAHVIDIGCGTMALERELQPGSRYTPADLYKRDDRTLVCDLNAGEFPDVGLATHIAMLGVLEYLTNLPATLAWARAKNRPVVLSYCPVDRTDGFDRPAHGWMNAYSTSDLEQLFEESGFVIRAQSDDVSFNTVYRLEPADDESAAILPKSRVLVLSYSNVSNFGDRLGQHLVSGILPPGAVVEYGNFRPWTIPHGPFDLVILGIGNSLFRPIMSDELEALIRDAPRAIGIFGTQYRTVMPKDRLDRLVDHLDRWYARYEEDVLLYGGGKAHVTHLGDWLIDLFPMTKWQLDRSLRIERDIMTKDLSLDRVIQRIQRYRTVHSERLHPLLCALTSAEQVSYVEQREVPEFGDSGKFRSMLMDVFGRTFPEQSPIPVDHAAVASYKAKVRENIRRLSDDIVTLLAR